MRPKPALLQEKRRAQLIDSHLDKAMEHIVIARTISADSDTFNYVAPINILIRALSGLIGSLAVDLELMHLESQTVEENREHRIHKLKMWRSLMEPVTFPVPHDSLRISANDSQGTESAM